MKTVLIVIGIIFYISIGACIAAIEESDRFDKTGEFGLNPLIWFFWPIYVTCNCIINIITKFKEKS